MKIIIWQRLISVVTLSLFVSISSYCQPSFDDEQTPLSYIVHKVPEPLEIDGLANEKEWKDAAWSSWFVDIEGDKKNKPKYDTRFKMLWDEQYLFVYAELEEPHIWAKLTEHDQIVYHDNDFEIFIDPDGDAHNYFEIEVNALATVFDLFMSKPYRIGGLALIPWNSNDLKINVHVDGTLNDPTDIDNKWSVEMAIPFSSITLGNHVLVPEEGSIWRINFSRVEWEVEVKDNAYHKKINPETGRPFSEYNWVWSPQGVINMHYPEKWGYVQFTTRQPQKTVDSFSLPEIEKIKNELWKVYHLQKSYYHQNRRYTSDLKDLNIENDQPHTSGLCQIKMESTAMQFTARIKCEKTKEVWSINQEGLITKIEDFKNQ